MLKPAESLNVNNSSEHTGVAHLTSQNYATVKEAVTLAVKLQEKTYDIKFFEDMYMDDMLKMEQDMCSVIDALSLIMGRACVERTRYGLQHDEQPVTTAEMKKTFKTCDIARELGKTPQWLNKALKEKGVVELYGDKWIVAPQYASMGLITFHTSLYTDKTNREKAKFPLNGRGKGVSL